MKKENVEVIEKCGRAARDPRGFAISSLSKNKSKLWLPAVAVIALALACAGCGTRQPRDGRAAGSQAATTDSDYFIKYDWPERPRVGTYTLRVNLTDRSGDPVEGAEVAVSYDMPSMRGAHATTETMMQNARGDYLIPIRFVMPGDWEIVVSAHKDGVEIATETILLDF